MAKPQLTFYVVAMIALIVSVDVLFFKDHFLGRLLINIGIVLICIAVYLRFFK